MSNGREGLAAKPISPSRWLPPKRLIRRQQTYIAVAVAIYAGLWAADRFAGVGTTLVYTLSLGNLISLVQTQLTGLYARKRPLHSWSIYLGLVLIISVLGVAVVNLILFPIHRFPGQTLWHFLKSGWKIPFIATVIVGVSTELYRRMRERLETKNSELQRKVELEVAERALYDQELQQAREIQQSLLPKEIPQIPGFEIDGAWEPAREVGGDYFDVIRLSGTRLGICIADVVGKSVSAALLMANVQASVRAFAADSPSPAVLCRRVNSVLCSSIGSGKFVTFFYGVLDADRHSLEYSNAGHPLPILIRSGGGKQELKNAGAVLGIFPNWQYENSLLQLAPGDRLLLFTDGITEAGLPEAEEFGEQRLLQCARSCEGLSTRDLKSKLLMDVKQYCDSQLRDDATLIVVSALPESKRRTAGHLELSDAISTWEH